MIPSPPAPDSDVPSGLSPRLRQTLDGLLAGQSEKQIALRLGISRFTVHKYVTELHRRFGVSTNGELLARWITRLQSSQPPRHEMSPVPHEKVPHSAHARQSLV